VIYTYDPAWSDGDAPGWVVPDLPGDGNGLYHTDVYYDFGYMNSQAFFGATDGLQLGDRNWTAHWSTGVQAFVQEDVELAVYPMPIENQATVSFKLNRESLVQMEVYSLTGQRVADIVHTQYPAGRHQVSLNADMLNTGMYLLRMKAGEQSSTIKLIVK
jgi:hypothetical protein